MDLDSSSDGWSLLGDDSGGDDDSLARRHPSEETLNSLSPGRVGPAADVDGSWLGGGDEQVLPAAGARTVMDRVSEMVAAGTDFCDDNERSSPPRSPVMPRGQDAWVQIKVSATSSEAVAAGSGAGGDCGSDADTAVPLASSPVRTHNQKPLAGSPVRTRNQNQDQNQDQNRTDHTLYKESSGVATCNAPPETSTAGLLILTAAVSFASGVMGTLVAGAYVRDQIKRKKAAKRLRVWQNNNSRNDAPWMKDSNDFVSAFFARRTTVKPQTVNAKDASLDLSDYVERLLLFPSRL
jgi:hypothetical protein